MKVEATLTAPESLEDLVRHGRRLDASLGPIMAELRAVV
jgi:hypothetical protein